MVSPGQAGLAYVHFAGVRPDLRGRGLARALYARFGEVVSTHGCGEMRAITAPGNEVSLQFHCRLGFEVEGPVHGYNGPERPMLVFRRTLPVEM